jgi:hypothetical protein
MSNGIEIRAKGVDAKRWAVVTDGSRWFLGKVWVPSEPSRTGPAIDTPRLREWSCDEPPPLGLVKLDPFYDFNRESGIRKNPQGAELVRNLDLVVPFLFGGMRAVWVHWTLFFPIDTFYPKDLKEFDDLIERAESVRGVLAGAAGEVSVVSGLGGLKLPPPPGGRH